MIYHEVTPDAASPVITASATSMLLSVEYGSAALFYGAAPAPIDLRRGIAAGLGYQIVVPAGVDVYASARGAMTATIVTTAFGA